MVFKGKSELNNDPADPCLYGSVKAQIFFRDPY